MFGNSPSARVIFFLGVRDFWALVEPQYAGIARLMYLKGEWIVPTVNDDFYTSNRLRS
jgi:4-amino-4-deoxy-L-arabinose transferase-like glycosyltransferase